MAKMKSREPRSTFKKSWGTMKDNISYTNDFFSFDISTSISPSPSTVSPTPSSSSGFDSLILRRERRISRIRINESKVVTNNKNYKICINEAARDINHNHGVNNNTVDNNIKSVDNNNKITKPIGTKNSQKAINLRRAKVNNNAESNSTNKGNKVKTEKQIMSVKIEQKQEVKASEGYVGFSSFKSQISRKHVRKGFKFNLMVIGETGLGKSTLINSMFLADVYPVKSMLRSSKTMKVEKHNVVLEEGGVKLLLTVVDTPGYGDAVDNTGCWEPVVEYVEKQLDKFFESENRVNRVSLPDSRVHACLHFIAPSGHGIKRLDVEVMKRLQDKVNIIPVIGKADSCTSEEMEVFKQNIIHQLKQHKIQTYHFPDLKDSQNVPFALIGSNVTIKSPEGQVLKVRRYPWGDINIEDQTLCDFSLLQHLLVSRNMEDMKDFTNSVHYENFRSKKLSIIAAIDEEKLSIPNKNPLAVLEDETVEHVNKVKLVEIEMGDVFTKKVKEKIKKMNKMAKENYKDIEDQNKYVENIKEQVKSRRNSLERQKSLFEAQLLLSPCHSNNSTTSIGSTGKKKLFRFSLGSFKFKAND